MSEVHDNIPKVVRAALEQALSPIHVLPSAHVHFSPLSASLGAVKPVVSETNKLIKRQNELLEEQNRLLRGRESAVPDSVIMSGATGAAIATVRDGTSPMVEMDPDINFGELHFHPDIIECAGGLLTMKFYAQAVEAAMKAVNSRVRNLYHTATGEDLDGKALMMKAFVGESPSLVVTGALTVQSQKSMQEGLGHLLAGAMLSFRNPLAHDNVKMQRDEAIKKLHFASLLMTMLDTVRVKEATNE